MGNFCPFIRENCRKDCVFRTITCETDNYCRLNSAAVSVNYLANIIGDKIDEDDVEPEIDPDKLSS